MSTHHGLLIHLIFSTKYRKRYLATEWRDDLYAYIGGIVKDHKSVLLMAGGIEDHIHLLLGIHPDYAISKTVQLLKGNSSKWINEQRMLPGRFEWQRGYGAFSVSKSMKATVSNYIANQEEHHKNRTYKEEYLRMLQNQEIVYDPRYVFDEEIIS